MFSSAINISLTEKAKYPQPSLDCHLNKTYVFFVKVFHIVLELYCMFAFFPLNIRPLREETTSLLISVHFINNMESFK